MAKDAGFHDVKYIGKWKDYEIVEPIFTDGEIHYIGYPQYILIEGSQLRWTADSDESLAIFEDLQ